MKTLSNDNRRRGESGNILFLILIAVALFAALSYAVTQSSRSSGGDVSGEKTLVSSSELTQYPAGIRTSILRMIVDTGLTADQLEFDTPSSFGTVVTTNNQRQEVFHPAGGGETYETASPDIMASGAQGVWHFNSKFQVQNVGLTDNSDSNGNDIMAFLDGVSKGVCTQMDNQLGIGAIPTIALTQADIDSDQVATANGADTSTFFNSAGAVISGTGLTGQPFGCFQNTNGSNYVYYHIIIER